MVSNINLHPYIEGGAPDGPDPWGDVQPASGAPKADDSAAAEAAELYLRSEGGGAGRGPSSAAAAAPPQPMSSSAANVRASAADGSRPRVLASRPDIPVDKSFGLLAQMAGQLPHDPDVAAARALVNPNAVSAAQLRAQPSYDLATQIHAAAAEAVKSTATTDPSAEAKGAAAAAAASARAQERAFRERCVAGVKEMLEVNRGLEARLQREVRRRAAAEANNSALKVGRCKLTLA